jgi:5-enolpyruvylshikimate-3-phosphate synthase
VFLFPQGISVIVDGQLAKVIDKGDVSSVRHRLLLTHTVAQTEIKVTTRLESRPYASLTLDVLRSHEIVVETTRGLRHFVVPGKQRYKPAVHTIPGDYSSASFLMAAAVLTGSSIIIENLVPNQPDSMIMSLLRQMGTRIEEADNQVQVEAKAEAGGRKENERLTGIEVDARDIPDLVPIIAAVGCRALGETRIVGAKRLRIKESDRLSSLSQELEKFGANVTEDDDLDEAFHTGGQELILMEITGCDGLPSLGLVAHHKWKTPSASRVYQSSMRIYASGDVMSVTHRSCGDMLREAMGWGVVDGCHPAKRR